MSSKRAKTPRPRRKEHRGAVRRSRTPNARSGGVRQYSDPRLRRLMAPHHQRGRKAEKEWLRVGATVAVGIGKHSGKQGVIRYFGPVKFARGKWVGLEVDKKDGQNDGAIFGHRYFTCDDNKGLFLKAALLFPLSSPDNPAAKNSLERALTTEPAGSKEMSLDLGSGSGRRRLHALRSERMLHASRTFQGPTSNGSSTGSPDASSKIKKQRSGPVRRAWKRPPRGQARGQGDADSRRGSASSSSHNGVRRARLTSPHSKASLAAQLLHEFGVDPPASTSNSSPRSQGSVNSLGRKGRIRRASRDGNGRARPGGRRESQLTSQRKARNAGSSAPQGRSHLNGRSRRRPIRRSPADDDDELEHSVSLSVQSANSGRPKMRSGIPMFRKGGRRGQARQPQKSATDRRERHARRRPTLPSDDDEKDSTDATDATDATDEQSEEEKEAPKIDAERIAAAQAAVALAVAAMEAAADEDEDVDDDVDVAPEEEKDDDDDEEEEDDADEDDKKSLEQLNARQPKRRFSSRLQPLSDSDDSDEALERPTTPLNLPEELIANMAHISEMDTLIARESGASEAEDEPRKRGSPKPVVVGAVAVSSASDDDDDEHNQRQDDDHKSGSVDASGSDSDSSDEDAGPPSLLRRGAVMELSESEDDESAQDPKAQSKEEENLPPYMLYRRRLSAARKAASPPPKPRSKPAAKDLDPAGSGSASDHSSGKESQDDEDPAVAAAAAGGGGDDEVKAQQDEPGSEPPVEDWSHISNIPSLDEAALTDALAFVGLTESQHVDSQDSLRSEDSAVLTQHNLNAQKRKDDLPLSPRVPEQREEEELQDVDTSVSASASGHADKSVHDSGAVGAVDDAPADNAPNNEPDDVPDDAPKREEDAGRGGLDIDPSSPEERSPAHSGRRLGSGPLSPKSGWSCPVCTFVNAPLHLVCDVCGGLQPPTYDPEDEPPPPPRSSSWEPHHHLLDEKEEKKALSDDDDERSVHSSHHSHYSDHSHSHSQLSRSQSHQSYHSQHSQHSQHSRSRSHHSRSRASSHDSLSDVRVPDVVSEDDFDLDYRSRANSNAQPDDLPIHVELNPDGSSNVQDAGGDSGDESDELPPALHFGPTPWGPPEDSKNEPSESQPAAKPDAAAEPAQPAQRPGSGGGAADSDSDSDDGPPGLEFGSTPWGPPGDMEKADARLVANVRRASLTITSSPPPRSKGGASGDADSADDTVEETVLLVDKRPPQRRQTVLLQQPAASFADLSSDTDEEEVKGGGSGGGGDAQAADAGSNSAQGQADADTEHQSSSDEDEPPGLEYNFKSRRQVEAALKKHMSNKDALEENGQAQQAQDDSGKVSLLAVDHGLLPGVATRENSYDSPSNTDSEYAYDGDLMGDDEQYTGAMGDDASDVESEVLEDVSSLSSYHTSSSDHLDEKHLDSEDEAKLRDNDEPPPPPPPAGMLDDDDLPGPPPAQVDPGPPRKVPPDRGPSLQSMSPTDESWSVSSREQEDVLAELERQVQEASSSDHDKDDQKKGVRDAADEAEVSDSLVSLSELRRMAQRERRRISQQEQAFDELKGHSDEEPSVSVLRKSGHKKSDKKQRVVIGQQVEVIEPDDAEKANADEEKEPVRVRGGSLVDNVEAAVLTASHKDPVVATRFPDDPSYMLHIRVVEAQGLPAADVNGLSDPYVKVWVQGGGFEAASGSKERKLLSRLTKAKTRVIRKTLDPIWSEDFSLVCKEFEGMLEFTVKDHDVIGSNDFLGQVQIPLSTFKRRNFVGGWFDLVGKSGSNKKSKGRLRLQVVVDRDFTDKGVDPEALSVHRKTMLLRSSRVSKHLSQQDEQHLELFVASWNVGNAPPPEELGFWLCEEADVYVIGTQECEYDHADEDTQTHWGNTLHDVLGRDDYSLIASNHLLQMRIHVFASNTVAHLVRDVRLSREATGVGGVVGNKGGVAVSLAVNDTTMCFVNCHLAAHQDKVSKRNDDVAEIIRGLRLGKTQVDVLHQFDHVVFFGDLNYRLSFGDQGSSRTPTNTQFKKMVDLINQQKFSELFKYDQLAIEMKANRVLLGFQETTPNFFPTFKLHRNKVLEYTPQRSPAWCDRIAWKSLPGCRLMQTRFEGVFDICTSDHKPIFGLFDMSVRSLPPAVDNTRGRCTIAFRNLRARNLPAADVDGFSDPYLKFKGPALRKSFKTKYRKKTLNPDWNDAEVPVLTPIVNDQQRLRAGFLSIQVWDHDVASPDDLLGFALLHFSEIIPAVPLEHVGHPLKEELVVEKDFELSVTMGGLPAGRLMGTVIITWEAAPFLPKLLSHGDL